MPFLIVSDFGETYQPALLIASISRRCISFQTRFKHASETPDQILFQKLLIDTITPQVTRNSEPRMSTIQESRSFGTPFNMVMTDSIDCDSPENMALEIAKSASPDSTGKEIVSSSNAQMITGGLLSMFIIVETTIEREII